MGFDKEYLKAKTNQFYDAYFALVNADWEDHGKRLEDVPAMREMNIDDDYKLISYRGARYALYFNPEDYEVYETYKIDIPERGFTLLYNYLMRIV